MDELRAAAGRDAPSGRFERLFRRHHAAVVAYVRRRSPSEAADDAVEETFLVAWRRLDQIPPDNELPWLLGVARNVLATQRRGATRRYSLTRRAAAASEGISVPGPAELGAGSLDPRLAQALATLTAKDREALTLIAWDGLEPQEAALAMGVSPGAFRVRLHRARHRLRRALEKRPDEPTGSESRLRVEGIAHD